LPRDQVAADAALDRIEVWWDATRRRGASTGR
jgi:hypothetical protein